MHKQMPSARDALATSGRLLRSIAVATALACSAVVSAVLPGAVASADELAGTTVVGQLVQVWAEAEHEGAHHGAQGPLSFVETVAGDAVRVPTEDVGDLPVGGTVSVTVGSQVDDEAADEHGVEPARTVLASDLVAAPDEAASPATPSRGLTNEVTVVLVTPAGAAPDGTTVADVVEAVDGPVADFWAEQSNGAIRVGVTATHDWTTTTAGCSDPTKLWNEAAAEVGFEAGDGKHLLLYVTETAPDCAYALAEVGHGPVSGGRLYVRDTIPSVIAHEFGHNFGLGHSSGRQCDAAVETGTCRTSAYRDYYDVMGVSWEQLGSLNAAQAARLDVLPAAQVQALSVDGGSATVTLSPLAGSTGTRALRLTDVDDADYWLEYRTPTARDAWLTGGNRYGLDSGVLLRQAGKNLPDTSLLLDGTPSSAAGWNGDLKAALPVGVAVPVSGGDFSVVVEDLGAGGATLRVVPSQRASAGTPVPPAAPAVPGTVMAGTGIADGVESEAPQTHPASPASGSVALRIAPRATAVEPVADLIDGLDPLIPFGGAALLGGALLLVRRLRAPLPRR
jgi:hypothetical protein